MPISDLTTQKAACRDHLKKIRASIPAEQRQAYAKIINDYLLNLNEVQSARAIFLFISYSSEVDTHALISALLEAGKDLAVPRIIDSKKMIATPFTSFDELIKGQLGILTPQGSEPYPGTVDVAITPGLGFTRQGHRIGYGRGYYDKWFAQNPTTQRIAISYSQQILDEIPVDENDVLMHKIVTEKEIITISD